MILVATLSDGRTVRYHSDVIGEGGMKQVHFTEDRSSVVCFFKDPTVASDPTTRKRLDAILTKYNPTLDPATSAYWSKLFCWPTAVIVKPRLGVMAPTYPANFFFKTGPAKSREKQGRWFSSPKLRRMLPPDELGSWIDYFRLCILMARAVRRMHVAGLAHSDLSANNVLVDPTSGQSIVIDCYSLVVPGLYPPDVLGTPGYIAPEVLATASLPLKDPSRKLPNASTDQHALAVLIYEYLLNRHPLKGQKFHSAVSEQDDFMMLGPKALFVEHPTDSSNPSAKAGVSYKALGPQLASLFEQTFVQGLHAPQRRAAAIEWERALVKTWDHLYPCSNIKCTHQWFVVGDSDPVICPFCGQKQAGPIAIIQLRKEARPGQWVPDGKLVVRQDLVFFSWHVVDNVFPGELADRTPQGYCALHEGRWILINQKMPSLTSPSGQRVPPGQAVELADGAIIRLSHDQHGRMAEVHLVNR